MKFELHRADRSPNNESEVKDVYGSITRADDDRIICFVPNEKMGKLILSALEGSMSIANCDFRADFTEVLYGKNESSSRRVKDSVRKCHEAFQLL